MEQRNSLGFIGLGNMGGRMTQRLVEAGFEVHGYDTDSARVDSAGARVCTNTAELMRQSDIIMLSLPDSRVIEAVVEGEDGLLSCCRKGQVIIDLSTAAANSTVRLAKRFAEHDVNYLDAGISGGAAAAEKGALTLMIGGNKPVLDSVRWALEPIAARVNYMGESGAGHITKLINNFLNAVALSATAEAMVAGRKAGLDLHSLLDVLNHSSGVNFATLNRFPRIIEGDYLEGGLTGKLMTKDLALYVDCARELGVASLNSAGPMASFGLGTSLGYGDQISNRVVDAIGDVSGGVRLFEQQESAS